jgi:hypothetical protein
VPTSSVSDNITTMSADDCFENLPWQSWQRQIGHINTKDSDKVPDGRDYD